MDHNPLIDVANNIQQKKLEDELHSLIDELSKMNTRLTNIEALLQKMNTPENQTYIKG